MKVSVVNSLIAFFLVVFVLNAVAANDTTLPQHYCDRILSYNPDQLELFNEPGYLISEKTYLAFDPYFGNKFYFHAEVDMDAISFRAYTRTRNGNHGKFVRAGEEMAKAIKHFEGKFNRLELVWTEDDLNMTRSQMREFRDALAEGASPEVAASLTWSGKQAIKNGYNKLIVDTNGENPESAEMVRVYCFEEDSDIYRMFREAQINLEND